MNKADEEKLKAKDGKEMSLRTAPPTEGTE
jgi:hypothetical protein